MVPISDHYEEGLQSHSQNCSELKVAAEDYKNEKTLGHQVRGWWSLQRERGLETVVAGNEKTQIFICSVIGGGVCGIKTGAAFQTDVVKFIQNMCLPTVEKTKIKKKRPRTSLTFCQLSQMGIKILPE